MKNLFKNLMLVAVAAMAFTACSKDNNDVNAVSKITRYEFTANIADDTRSGFAEKEEGATAYKSEWFGNETIKLFVTDYNGYYVETTAPINTKGQFTLELENAPESFFMTVVSPADSWVSENTATIPTEQTPLANSVDPKAHLLQAQAMPVNNGAADINMNHLAAYGKMTVNGVDFAIDHVVVDLKGTFYGYDREYSYTINADNVENNTFWFATEPIDVVAEFTVTAYDAEDNTVTKTVDVAAAGKTLAFKYGCVSTFSVSGLEEYVEPEETYDYTSARVSWNWGSTDKMISFTSGAGVEDLHVNFNGRSFSDNSIAAGDYSIGDGIYGSGIYLGDYFEDRDGECDSAYTGNLSVTIVDGCYVMVFTDLKDYYGVMLAERITFKGLIDGLELPDPRTKLAAPTNIQTSVAGKTITITWNAVEHADYYTVSVYSPVQHVELVTGNQYVFEAENSNTKYWFKITATASDDNPTYRTSDEEFFEATTEDTDPKMILSVTELSFTADGGEKTFDVTLKNTDATLEFTKEGDWFSVEKSGNTFTVTADVNESETVAPTGSITITAGELSQTIAVNQSKKAAEGGSANMAEGAIVLTIVGHGWGYVASSESEILFQESAGMQHLIDFSAFPNKGIKAGYFTSANVGNIVLNYCTYKYGNTDAQSMTFAEAWVKDNGDGTFNFEVNFTAGGQKYYFTYDLDPTK